MFSENSRYKDIEIATWVAPDGREIKYVRRRFQPPKDAYPIKTEHIVKEEERVDHITAKYLNDPELFWRVCDANHGLNPQDLTAETNPPRRLLIPEFLGG